MSTKVLTGTFASGYYVSSPITVLSVTSSGYVEGSGVSSGHTATYTVINDGRVVSADNGVLLADGGQVTNGAATDADASIQGYQNGVELAGAGGVVNYGSIVQTGPASLNEAGVYETDGGAVSNGSLTDTHALIAGAYGVWVKQATGTVTNFGSIVGEGASVGPGVYLGHGGAVTNGGTADWVALIIGGAGVATEGASATVSNFATIESTQDWGVLLGGGGVLTNGSAPDTAAVVQGASVGVDANAVAATVANYGSIEGGGSGAIVFAGGGKVTNGDGADRTALISGYQGVSISGAAGTVTNFATIMALGGAGDFAVALASGGAVTNGSTAVGSAVIEGYSGLYLAGAGSSLNLDLIEGAGGSGGAGVILGGKGAALSNGEAGETSARIQGYIGAELSGASTLTNFGTVQGVGGIAVEGESSTATLIVEAGSVFEGSVTGGGGVVELGSGVGTLSGLAGGDVTVSGSMATTKFDAFGTVKVGSEAQFTLTGNASVAGGEALTDAGSLTAAGTITVGGTVTTTGALAGAGTLALAGGAARFDAGTALTLAHVTVSGAATATFADASLAYAGLWTQTAGALTVKAGDAVSFTGTGDAFAGTLAGAGTVAFTGGSDTLTGTTLSANSVTINAASVTLLDAITITHQLTAATADLIIGSAGATLTGGGTLALTNAATNRITVTAAAATLTNLNDTILGAGTIGDGAMTLINETDGTINGDDPVALIINTGAHVITNAGTIEATGAGGLTLSSPVDNGEVLWADGGTLTVDGAVTGAGVVQIDAGTADIATTGFTENVDFTGTTGILELASSKTYSGQITGLSKSGTNSLDLKDIAFAGTTTAAYSGTAASGVLTVKEGSSVASIHLVGDYLGSTFTLSAAAGGGTKVVDPAPSPASPPAVAPLTRFIAAAAGFAAPAIDPRSITETWRAPPPLLALPRTHSL